MVSLPLSLSEIAGRRSGLLAADPETGRPYEFIVKNANDYELCANFAGASDARGRYANAFWSHPRGRACFAFELGRPVLC